MTAAIAATPEGLLAASIAEYVQVTRQTIANLRALRVIVSAAPPEAELLTTCDYVTIYRGEPYDCCELARVINLADDAAYCLRHHDRAERNRP